MALSRCESAASLYDPLSLGLPTISSFYAECHALSYAKLGLSTDLKVHLAPSTKLAKGSAQKRKLSSLASTHDLVSPILATDTKPLKTKHLFVKTKRLLPILLAQKSSAPCFPRSFSLLTPPRTYRCYLEVFIYSIARGLIYFVL